MNDNKLLTDKPIREERYGKLKEEVPEEKKNAVKYYVVSFLIGIIIYVNTLLLYKGIVSFAFANGVSFILIDLIIYWAYRRPKKRIRY